MTVAGPLLCGLGFGLIFWLGVAPPDHPGWVAAVFAALALGLAAGGLLAERPQGHRRALALAALAAFGLHALLWIATDRPAAPPGWLAAGLAAASVASMAMRPGADPLALPVRLATAAAGGALLAGATQPALWSLAALALAEAAAWIRGGTPAARPTAPFLRGAGLALAALLPLALLLAFPFKHTLAGIVVLSHVAGAAILAALRRDRPGRAVGLRGGSG